MNSLPHTVFLRGSMGRARHQHYSRVEVFYQLVLNIQYTHKSEKLACCCHRILFVPFPTVCWGSVVTKCSGGDRFVFMLALLVSSSEDNAWTDTERAPASSSQPAFSSFAAQIWQERFCARCWLAVGPASTDLPVSLFPAVWNEQSQKDVSEASSR